MKNKDRKSMKRGNCFVLFLLLALIPAGLVAQTPEYNTGNNYVHPDGQKFIGMDFVNAATGTLINNGTIWYSGNFTNNGTVDFSSTLALSPALSQFAGDALQHIAGTGTTRFYNLLFGSQLTPVAYSLEQPVTVAHQVDFTKGILGTVQTNPESLMNMLQLEANAVALHASDNSYVDGFVSKKGNTAFIFPIGNGGFYRPAGMNAPAVNTDCFAARYLYVNPETAGYSRTSKSGTLARVSDKEYWVVKRTAGSDNVSLTLSWDVTKTSAAVPNNLNNVVVARWDGVKWINEGNKAITGTTKAGTVTAQVTGYGVFTLANIVTHPPVAVKDSVSTREDVAVAGNVLDNDSVFDGTTLAVSAFNIAGTSYQPGASVVMPDAGTFTLAANGAFTFIPVYKYSGIVPAITYTCMDIDGNTATGKLIVNVLAMPVLIKTAVKPVMNNDGSFSWTYTLLVQNNTPVTLTHVQVEDNLDAVFGNKGCTYKVTHISATGQLTANGLYDGSGNVNTLMDGMTLSPNKQDTIHLEVKVDTHGQKDTVQVFNQAVLRAKAPFGTIELKSDANTSTAILDPTRTDIPEVTVLVTDGFSPNGDGLNDKFTIVHPVGVKVEFEVFNRNGNSVYKSTDYQNDWDGKGSGTFMGRDLGDGTYYCSYKITKTSTGEVISKGTKFITIHR